MLQETVWLTCPYCGESFDTRIDCSGGDQTYIEDCQVCCRPIELKVACDEQGKLNGVEVRRDDD